MRQEIIYSLEEVKLSIQTNGGFICKMFKIESLFYKAMSLMLCRKKESCLLIDERVSLLEPGLDLEIYNEFGKLTRVNFLENCIKKLQEIKQEEINIDILLGILLNVYEETKLQLPKLAKQCLYN